MMANRTRSRLGRALLWSVVFLGAATFVVAVQAGGTINWAQSVEEFATEGEAVGQSAVTIAILAVGIVLAMALPSLLAYIVPLCLGGALMANASGVATLFGGGGGGGSVLHTTYAVAAPTAVKATLAFWHLLF